jgi:hypothetical protein
MVLEVYLLSLSKPVPLVYALKRAHSRVINLRCAGFLTRLLIIRSVGAEWTFAYKQAGSQRDG